jgi:undecaprenyl-diphosphatase
MADLLENTDRQLFLFLNSCNSPFFDEVMHVLSGKLIWAPLYLAILIYLGFRYRRKFWIVLAAIALAVLLTDQVSVNLFKNVFQRPRPCHEPSLQGIIHLYNGECGSGFSFISAHASNSFNVALLSLMLIGRRWFSISILVWATLIGYSRIYLGVHYPGDVICGAMLGSLIGWSLSSLYFYIDSGILQQKPWFAGSHRQSTG